MAMRELPLLMNGSMVRATLDGRKTVTRRLVKPQPDYVASGIAARSTSDDTRLGRLGQVIRCRYGEVGDRLYVRETHFDARDLNERQVLYAATGDVSRMGWTPSIHMPKSLSRIWLEVTDVRVEQLQDITEDQARTEGVPWHGPIPGDWRHSSNSKLDALPGFTHLWDGLATAGTRWADNPWVWVVEFTRVNGEAASD
jgi:hypothetical protein